MTDDNFSALIYFIYGLSFYTMGISAWIQGSQKASAFTFVRSFKYLSCFGIIHGVVEWLLMLLDMGFFSEYRTIYWQFIIVLNVISFMFLWYFGIELLNSGYSKNKMNKRIPFYALGLWGIIVVNMVWINQLDWPMAIRHESLISRYLIGFPASITTAYGLIKTSKQYIFKSLKSTNLQMQVMASAFILYGIFAGLIDLNLNFYPANILNKELFFQMTGIKVEIVRTGLAMIITAMFIQIIPLFKYESELHIAHLKENQLMSAERKRLSRVLHDGVLQELFVTGLELESVKEDYTLDPKMEETLDNARLHINETMVMIRRFINEVTTGDFEISDLIIRLRQVSDGLAQKFGTRIQVIDLIKDASYGFINHETINNLFYMVQEGMINALKHSKTEKIDIVFRATMDCIIIEITDFGTGFDSSLLRSNEHLGLKSIYERAELIMSNIQIKSDSKGTQIIITTPWEVENES